MLVLSEKPVPPPMLVLSIESTCDESAVALIRFNPEPDATPGSKTEVLKHLIATHDHTSYGGVVPESAARQHFFFLPKMIEKISKEFDLKEVEFVCAATNPGLMGGIMLGTCAGKALAVGLDKPFVQVNHIKAHALSAMIENPGLKFPYICLLVSGGHTFIFEVKNFEEVQALATTKDDAMGELFDKVAKRLGLGFPGGRLVEQLARGGNKDRFEVKLPHIKSDVKQPIGDFSFSGLKTYFIRLIDKLELGAENLRVSDCTDETGHLGQAGNSSARDHELNKKYESASKSGPSDILEPSSKSITGEEAESPAPASASDKLSSIMCTPDKYGSCKGLSATDIADICACLQHTIARICIQKLRRTMETLPHLKQYCIVGGVASNQYIRSSCVELSQKYDKQIFFPSLPLCTDNAIMIGYSGYLNYINNRGVGLECEVSSTWQDSKALRSEKDLKTEDNTSKKGAV